jgi:hypothetical protein
LSPGQPDDFWVARILEIRALDKEHVFARVFWMYWPEELPTGTMDGRKRVQGRQPYHGKDELIASNHSQARPCFPYCMLSLADLDQWT